MSEFDSRRRYQNGLSHKGRPDQALDAK